MTNRQGEFVWYELMTRDADGAQGEILFGLSEIPGGDYIITGRDPQGAVF